MGGGASAEADSAKTQVAKNYLNNDQVRQEAQERGVDPALLAYAYQKQDQIDDSDMIRQRTQDEKKLALAQQEAALQARIDKAAADMELARQHREAIGVEKKPEPVIPGSDQTQVTRAPTMAEVQMSPRPSVSSKNIERGLEQQASSETPQQLASPFQNNSSKRTDEKLQQSDALQESAKFAAGSPIENSRSIQRKGEEPEFRDAAPASQSPAQPVQVQQDRNNMFDQDSEEENDDDFEQRSDPGGDPENSQVVKAQITTVQYNNSPPSPRNILAPDLRSSQSARSGAGLNQMLNYNKNDTLMLGMQESGREDQEANRNINMNDLADLLA